MNVSTGGQQKWWSDKLFSRKKEKENHVANGICTVIERFNCGVRVSSASTIK
jgi:hypothetical protein